MKNRYKILAVLFFIFTFSLQAREIVEKHFNKSYDVTNNSSLLLDNRFGSIVIKNTESNSIEIDINVKVEANSESKAQEISDRINIIIAKVGNSIKAVTEIQNSSFRGNVQLDIDYLITMPSSLNTKLEMKYGKVTIDHISGDFDGVVKYGGIVINSLLNNEKGRINNLYLAYCDGSHIEKAGRLKLDLAYSDCQIASTEAIHFDIKYSDLKIGDALMVKGDLAYSDLNIRNVKDVSVEGRYSDMLFRSVKKSGVIDSKYGDIEINQLLSGFDLLKVNASYSDVEVEVESGADYNVVFDISYGDLDMPSMYLLENDIGNTSKYYRGFVGSEESHSEMSIVNRYGDITVF